MSVPWRIAPSGPPLSPSARWIALALLAASIFALRWRLLDVPLERDEGEYALAGRLLLDGVPPYEGLVNMKLPGIYVCYAAVMAVFGQSVRGIHLGLACADVAAALLLFLLVRRLFDDVTGLVAAALFALLALGPGVQGSTANAEHFVLVPALAGLALVERGSMQERARVLFAAGLLLGIAIVIKQQGALLAVGGFLAAALRLCVPRPDSWRRVVASLALLALGIALPYGVTALWLAQAGVFDTFWLWTVRYATSYAGQIPVQAAGARLAERGGQVVGSMPTPWIAAGVGATALIWSRWVQRRGPFLIPFALFSFLAVCPGFFFRPHYFVLVLPAVATLAAVLLSATLGSKRTPVVVAGLLLAISAILPMRSYLFELAPDEISRSIYSLNPFPESRTVARYIEERSRPHDRIAVLGSEPQIAFYASRRLASTLPYTYALMETHELALDMQKQMIAEIEASQPRWLVYVDMHASWLWRAESRPRIFIWFARYREDYRLAARLAITPEGSTWLEDPEAGPPAGDLPALTPPFSLYLYERKE